MTELEKLWEENQILKKALKKVGKKINERTEWWVQKHFSEDHYDVTRGNIVEETFKKLKEFEYR